MRSVSSTSDQERQRSFIEAARRKQIVAATIDVLADQGYPSASLGAIADHLGVSKGIISYHFAGKAEVMSEVVNSVLAEAEEAMTPELRASTSYGEALDRYLATNLAFIAAHRRDVLAMAEVLSSDRQILADFSRRQAAAVDALAGIIQGGIEAGEFAAVPVRSSAIAMRAAIDAATALLNADPEAEAEVERYGDDLAALFRRALSRGAQQA